MPDVNDHTQRALGNTKTRRRRPDAVPGDLPSKRASAPWRRTIDVIESDALRAVATRERAYRLMLAAADMAAAGIALPLALTLSRSSNSVRPSYFLLLPFVVVVGKLLGLYDHDELVIRKSTLDEMPRLVNLTTTVVLLSWLGRRFAVNGSPHTPEVVAFWITMLFSTTTLRLIARRFAGRVSPQERCVVIGEPSAFKRLQDKLHNHNIVTLVGAVTPDRELADPAAMRVLGQETGAHRIIIAPSHSLQGEDLVDLVRAAKATGLRVSLVPDILGAVGSSVVFDAIGGMTLLGVRRFGLTRSSGVVKRAFDLAGAGVIMLGAAPVMALFALLIKLDSPGPVFFRQVRVGRDGNRFSMFKFRTMVENAADLHADLLEHNEAGGGLFKMDNDPRVTRVGKFLRKTSLDELPQLLNVLRGEMSLVGPRPLVIDEDKRITGFDRRRLALTPGMTGHWQTLGSSRVPLAEMVKIDYLYVANWSLWGDIKLILRTIPMVVSRGNR